MQYFIGIVPPDADKRRFEEFRNRWSSNGLKDVVEPHITVKAQGGLTEDLSWVHRVKEACARVSPFEVRLTEPATFGTDVVFLGVESTSVLHLHDLLLDAVSPAHEELLPFELEDYHPHLTLGQTRWGMAPEEISEMERAAMALAPYSSFTVTFVRIYKEVALNKYLPFKDISLSF